VTYDIRIIPATTSVHGIVDRITAAGLAGDSSLTYRWSVRLSW